MNKFNPVNEKGVVLESIIKEYIQARPNQDDKDKEIIARLTHYLNNEPKDNEEIKDKDEVISLASATISRAFYIGEIMKDGGGTQSWLNQFQTEDLKDMMYQIKKRLVA